MSSSKSKTPRPAQASPSWHTNSFLEAIAFLAANSPAGIAALVKPTSLTKVAGSVAKVFEGQPFPRELAIITELVKLERRAPQYFLDITVVMARRPSPKDKYLASNP